MNIEKSTRNQLGNAKNVHQGSTKKVLCVCSAGLLRSPTLANEIHKHFGYNTRAVGACKSFALVPLSEALLAWADQIVFVDFDCYREATADPDDERAISMEFSTADILILDLPDQFDWNNTDLCHECLQQYMEAS